MTTSPSRRFLPAILTAAILAALPSPSQAQDQKAEPKPQEKAKAVRSYAVPPTYSAGAACSSRA